MNDRKCNFVTTNLKLMLHYKKQIIVTLLPVEHGSYKLLLNLIYKISLCFCSLEVIELGPVNQCQYLNIFNAYCRTDQNFFGKVQLHPRLEICYSQATFLISFFR